MKIRTDFITNSSSTSYIVIHKDVPSLIPSEVYTLGKKGKTDFGRFWERYNDVYSKLNYLAIAILTCNISQEKKLYYRKMLDSILLVYGWSLHWDDIISMIENSDAYIDHQSLDIAEQTLEYIMNDKTLLLAFLYSDKSSVIMGSDESMYRNVLRDITKCAIDSDYNVIMDACGCAIIV